jgi:hypothetical protein
MNKFDYALALIFARELVFEQETRPKASALKAHKKTAGKLPRRHGFLIRVRHHFLILCSILWIKQPDC